MPSVSDAPRNSGGASPPRTRHVCPFCGTLNDTPVGPCVKCTMQNTPQTRRVTRGRIGPWYVLQSRNPAAPGMKFDVLVGFIRKGQVTARSIVRGPTTHQFWRYAAHVKGLSREFGLCYSCGVDISTESNLCPHCGKLQEPPVNPDTLLEGQTPLVSRSINTRVAAMVSPIEVEAAPSSIPEMVDAEVVIPKPTSGQAKVATPQPTRVIIEPLVEPQPPLAESEPIIEPEPVRTTGYGRGNGHSNGYGNGHRNGNGNGNGHGVHVDYSGRTSTVDADRVPLTEPTIPPADTANALMSPADLAAAFHVKFAPVAEFNHQDPPKKFAVSGRGVLWVVVALLIASVVVGAILFPDERMLVLGKVTNTWRSVVRWFEGAV